MSILTGTYNSSYAEIQPELLSDESVLWTGQPQKKVVFHQRDGFAVPFSLIWNGFVLAAFSGGFRNLNVFSNWKHNDPFKMLFAVVFVMVGQYVLWGRFLYTAWRKGRTHYAVTTKRVMVLNAGPTRKITDAYFAKLDSVSLSVRADGIGTIEFSPQSGGQTNWWGGNRNQPTDIDLTRLIFYDIKDARSVYQLIEDQRRQSLKSAPPTGLRERR